MKWFIEFGYEELDSADLYDTKWRPLRTTIVDLPNRGAAGDFADKAAAVIAARYSGKNGELTEADVSAQIFKADDVLKQYEIAGDELLQEVKDAQQEDEA